MILQKLDGRPEIVNQGRDSIRDYSMRIDALLAEGGIVRGPFQSFRSYKWSKRGGGD